jgi:hypothetical protein
MAVFSIQVGDMFPRTDEEVNAVKELLTKMREDKRREEAIRKNKEHLENVVMSLIDAVGLVETKRIIRDINRALLGCDEEHPFKAN